MQKNHELIEVVGEIRQTQKIASLVFNRNIKISVEMKTVIVELSKNQPRCLHYLDVRSIQFNLKGFLLLNLISKDI